MAASTTPRTFKAAVTANPVGGRTGHDREAPDPPGLMITIDLSRLACAQLPLVGLDSGQVVAS
jgi:hypothetical protein